MDERQKNLKKDPNYKEIQKNLNEIEEVTKVIDQIMYSQ